MTIRIATGIARRGDRILLVASRYANHVEPLWNLPGGRQEPHELATETVAREIREETGLVGTPGALAYASESYDGETHVANLTFVTGVEGDVAATKPGDHVIETAWVPISELHSRMTVAVVREPLLAYLSGARGGYFGYHSAGVTIRWLPE